MTYESEIYEIIYVKMEELLNKMDEDYPEKYSRKLNNWMLEEFDKEIISNLTFVSSFESKYGNMFENIVKDIAKLKFGEENVPETIIGFGVSEREYETKRRELIIKNSKASNPKQYIISKYNKKENESILSDFRNSRVAEGRGESRIESRLTQAELPKLLDGRLDYEGEIYGQEVDLMIFDPEEEKIKLFEIKVGGDLDNSNAPKNIEKMLKIYSCLGDETSELYFATLYNKEGEGRPWNGIVKTHIGEDCILIGKNFWNVILKDITFNDFKEINKKVINDTNFNSRIKSLKNKYTTLDEFF